MATLIEQFNAYCEKWNVDATGRELKLLKGAFITGLQIGMSVAGQPHEEALDTLARWGAEADKSFYTEGD